MNAPFLASVTASSKLIDRNITECRKIGLCPDALTPKVHSNEYSLSPSVTLVPGLITTYDLPLSGCLTIIDGCSPLTQARTYSNGFYSSLLFALMIIYSLK